MASWTTMGHGMRRRTGAPTNHHEQAESVGQEMAERNHPTHEEAHEAAKAVGSPRIPVGTDVYSASPEATMDSLDEISPSQMRGTLIPKKNTQAADPTGMGTKQNRGNVPYNERLGASYRVTVPFTPTIDPAAGPTMQSAKIVPSVPGRANPNFQSGIEYSNL